MIFYLGGTLKSHPNFSILYMMKNLKEYIIQENKYIDLPQKSINDYIGNNIIRFSGITYNVCEQTYEDWINKLNIDEN